MKKPSNQPLTALRTIAAGALLVAGHPVSASIIYEENFDGLTAGIDLDGQGGFIKNGDVLNVVDQGDGDYAAGGPVTAGTWFEYAVALGTTMSAGWVWTTYTLEVNSSDTGRGAVLALNGGSTVGPGNWGSQNVQFASTQGAGTWQLRPGGDWANAVSSGITVAAPDTIIGGLHLDTGTAYLWVNPDEADFFDPSNGGTADATLGNAKLEGPMDHIILNGRNADTSPVYDDIMVATTSAEVGLPTVLPYLAITSFTSVGDGIWELMLKGESDTGYEFRSSTTLDFTPGTLVEGLEQADPGDPGIVLGPSDSILVTDSSGNGTVRMTLLGDPADFVRAENVEVPSLLDENFDLAAALPAGWSSNGPSNGTDWKAGIPSGAPTGPTTAISAPNCAGTNIDGNYTENADVSLFSPSFSVPIGSGATLSYQQFIDTDSLGQEDDDVGSVRILDAGNEDALIFEITDIAGEGGLWTSESLPLPSADVGGKNIRVEFRFTSGAGSTVWSGFYVDDVKVVIAAPQP